MDFSQSTGVQIMSPIAKASGCNYVPFSQMKLIGEVESKIGVGLKEGHNGVCYGLAVAWLEALHQSSSSSDFVGDVCDIHNSATFYRAYSAYRHQETYKHLDSGTLSGTNYSARDRFFDVGAIEQNKILESTGEERSFYANAGGMNMLTAWICDALPKRYSMLSIPGHAMAAMGSKGGHCSFFDPNFGVVYSMKAAKVANAIADFFANAIISPKYKYKGQNWLVASKFK